MSGFIVEYESPWADYPTWEEYERVATADEGEALITQIIEKDYARAMERWQEAQPRLERSRDLFNRRRAALEAVGLWKQPGESFIPIMITGRRADDPVSEPVRQDRSVWRVRPATDEDDE